MRRPMTTGGVFSFDGHKSVEISSNPCWPAPDELALALA